MFLTEHTEFTERKRKEQNVGFIRLRRIKPTSFSVHSVRAIFGFTLIELMIVIVVIAILVGITLPVSKYVAQRAREASQRIYIEKIKSALEDYRAAYGEYPITPATNDDGTVNNYADVLRHYPEHYATYCYYITNNPYDNSGKGSPFINVDLAKDTVEIITTAGGTRRVDYGLTYPLMLRQRAEGVRPFMEFQDITVVYFVTENAKQQKKIDVGTIARYIRTEGGVGRREADYILGTPVNRPEAIDPLSRKQWKYTSPDGVTYALTTNSF